MVVNSALLASTEITKTLVSWPVDLSIPRILPLNATEVRASTTSD